MAELNLRALQREDRPSPSGRGREESESGVALLERWVERPDGRMEVRHTRLTREDYLNPRFGDKWLQGREHSEVSPDVADRLRRWFGPRPDILVLNDVQHRLGPGFPNPSPDVSVIQGARHPDRDLTTFDVIKQGTVPRLIVEVISPRDRRIREVDEVDKVALYQRCGVPEYLLVGLPRRPSEPYQISGHRLDPSGVYQPIVPDEQGRLLSETTGLWFAVSPEGEGVVIRDAATGELLRTSKQEEQERKLEAEARQAAEAKAATEAEARQAAETELDRLRAEIERLRGGR